MSTMGRAFMFAVFACGAMLAACDDAPTEQGSDTSAKTSKSGAPKVAGLPAEMVAAVSGGRSAGAIGVHFALGNAPTVDKALPVEIAIVPHQDFVTVSGHFESHDGLVLISGDSFGPQSDVGAEKAIKHQLVLMPAKEGLFMVTAAVETEGTEGTVTRIFSIPVIVRPATASPAAAPAPKEGSAPAVN